VDRFSKTFNCWFEASSDKLQNVSHSLNVSSLETVCTVAYLGFWKGARRRGSEAQGRGMGRGLCPLPRKKSFLCPQNNNFWCILTRFFLSHIGATTEYKTYFLCRTTYCACLKTITQPITIHRIKPKISGNINFLKIFQLCIQTLIFRCSSSLLRSASWNYV